MGQVIIFLCFGIAGLFWRRLFGGWYNLSRTFLTIAGVLLFSIIPALTLPWPVAITTPLFVLLHLTPGASFTNPFSIMIRYTVIPFLVVCLWTINTVLGYTFILDMPSVPLYEVYFILTGGFVAFVDSIANKIRSGPVHTFIDSITDTIFGKANHWMVDGWEAYYELAVGFSTGLLFASPILWTAF